MKDKKKAVQEQWIGEVLDHADQEDLLRISGIHSRAVMPLPNREKLAWSVIDKANLADEEEMERRRKFQKELRKKKILHGLTGSGIVVAVIAILAFCGVFDGKKLKTYSYTVQQATAYSAADHLKVVQPEMDTDSVYDPDELQDYSGTKDFPEVNQDKLDNTIYKVLAEYCDKNDYAVDDYVIQKQYQMMLNSDKKPILLVDVFGTCLDYSVEDDGNTWKDYHYEKASGVVCYADESAQSICRDTIYSELPSVDSLPKNMYVVKFRLAIEMD